MNFQMEPDEFRWEYGLPVLMGRGLLASHEHQSAGTTINAAPQRGTALSAAALHEQRAGYSGQDRYHDVNPFFQCFFIHKF